MSGVIAVLWVVGVLGLLCMLFSVFYRDVKGAVLGTVLTIPFGGYLALNPPLVFKVLGWGVVVAAVLTTLLVHRAHRFAKWGVAAHSLLTIGIIVTFFLRS